MTNKVKFSVGILIAAILATVPAYVSGDSKSSQKKIVLTSDNTLILNDAIQGEAVANLIVQANQLDKAHGLGHLLPKNDKPIYLFLRSPGGEMQTGIELLEALQGLNRPVDTITMFAASMAFQTVQSLGKRYIVKGGILMSHRGSGAFEGQFGGQKPSQVDNRKSLWESRMDEMDKQTVQRTKGKQTLETYQKAYSSELWVTGAQAVEQGYADELVTVSCDNTLSGTTTHSISFMGLVNIDFDMDNCPLNSTPMNVRVSKLPTNKGVMSMKDFTDNNGGFGSSCLVASGADPKKVCASNTELTMESLSKLRSQFTQQYQNIQNRIVPYGI